MKNENLKKQGKNKEFIDNQFQKGKSGNPKGRPSKKDCLTSLLKEEIEKICPNDKQNRTWKQLIVIATMSLAIKGNAVALKEVWERIDGKVTQTIAGDSENPIKYIIEDAGNDK